jgi:probable blue pigment (indigoidine) exporter
MAIMVGRDWFTTALAPMLWGTMPAAAAEAFTPGHPLLIAAVRSLGAGLGLLVVFRQLPPRDWRWRTMVLGTINVALTFALFFVSASRVAGGMIALLMALSPFWAALLSWPLLGERPKSWRLLLIALGVAGVALLVGASPMRPDPIGVMAGIAASACMGCGIVLVKKWGRPAPLLVFTGWQLLVGGILLAGLALATEKPPSSVSVGNALALVYLVLAGTVLAYALWFRGIERIGAQRTAMLLMLVPVVALAIDAVLFGRQLTGLQSMGVVVVLGCLSLDLRGAPRSPSKSARANPSGVEPPLLENPSVVS